MIYGCIAEKLGHSFSKEIHNRLFDYSYELKEVPNTEFDTFMRKKEFKAIAICGGKDGVIEDIFPPCGVCRQVMREFCGDDFEIYLLKADTIETYTLGQLLPVSFQPDHIIKE